MNREMIAAYLGMGALQALDGRDEHNNEVGEALNEKGWGQSELIQQMLSSCMPVFAYLLAEHIGEHLKYEGMYMYDVVEPLGMFFIRELHHTDNIPNAMTLLAKARTYAN